MKFAPPLSAMAAISVGVICGKVMDRSREEEKEKREEGKKMSLGRMEGRKDGNRSSQRSILSLSYRRSDTCYIADPLGEEQELQLRMPVCRECRKLGGKIH